MQTKTNMFQPTLKLSNAQSQEIKDSTIQVLQESRAALNEALPKHRKTRFQQVRQKYG